MTGFLVISSRETLQEYGIDGRLLMAIKSVYCQPVVCVCVNGKQSNSRHVDVVGLQQGCALSPLLFIIYTNWMDKLCRIDVLRSEDVILDGYFLQMIQF